MHHSMPQALQHSMARLAGAEMAHPARLAEDSAGAALTVWHNSRPAATSDDVPAIRTTADSERSAASTQLGKTPASPAHTSAAHRIATHRTRASSHTAGSTARAGLSSTTDAAKAANGTPAPAELTPQEMSELLTATSPGSARVQKQCMLPLRSWCAFTAS